MIILIPIGGKGNRFKLKGYKKPKSLIKVKNKEIIFHLLDNLRIDDNISYIYIPYNKEYVDYDFENIILLRYPNYKFKFLVLENQTRGAAETIYIALKNIFSQDIRYPISIEEMKCMFDKPILCIDSDNFYETDIIKMWNGNNCIFTFHSKTKDAKFSYIELDAKTNNIINIIEKKKISDNACCGAYGFDSYYNLMDYCKKILDSNIMQKDEFYTSGAIKEMINDKIVFINKNIENKYYFSLGTPEQIKLFEYSFLLDLDGTLINTDPIYIKVWNKLLKTYNLSCDVEFFNSFIKGKSDVSFLTYLSSNINNKELSKISLQKDIYFIEYLKVEEDILYDGVLDFLDKIQNTRIGIVTSCNKKAAEYVLELYNLKKYINILIASEDVVKHKPHPEAYIKAAKILKTNMNKCIIFEDSHSGYISAINCKPYKICMYYNGTNHFTKKIDNFTFDDYNTIDINNVVNCDIQRKYSVIKKIKAAVNYLPIKNIIKSDDSNIKTGYICDIYKYKMVIVGDEIQNIIVKTSNNDNELSKVAKKLNMYNNEIYFYNNISNIMNVNVPKYFCSFEYNDRKSFIMEDLNVYTGEFNINLNNNITILLSVVKNIFNMHNKFYFKNPNEIINSMKNLKKINEISYYKELITERFDKFISKNERLLTSQEIEKLRNIYENFDNILKKASTFPLSFCHGDLKSPNIFYKNNEEPYFLDWQYIHLNKGVSDIVFLLVESLEFDEKTSDLILNYYFKLMNEKRKDFSFDEFKRDFKNALCIFPFFVMVWFNSEDQDKLIDKTFPIKFMKNVLKYYKYYL